MAVQLRYAGLESRKQAEQVRFIHSATLMQAKQMIRVGNKSIMQLLFCRPGKRCKDKGFPAFPQSVARIEHQAGRQALSGQAHSRNMVFLCERQESVHNDRVHMDIEMSINMGQGEARFQKTFNLGSALGPDFFPRLLGKVIAQAGPGWIVGKIPLAVDDYAEVLSGESSPPLD